MASLKFKTRSNLSPQGKPRIYFCCHKDDFKKYFKSVTDEVLNLFDCAVWYRENGEEAVSPDHLDDLALMQLFVIPVTTAFLSTPSLALDVEFKFAVDNNVPILPIMKESGLEELFNKVCGQIQFLYNNKKDTTGLSYEEKLKTFLSSTLIKDDLAKKIRDAFDAYVFLSYRKKDRRHAEELMRLVHKNPRFRDVAIWYDEFLVPGENFNDCIKDALLGCDLFLLAVTPNLVNEANYVADVEYPMALGAGKPVLPAELLPTDKALLDKSFLNIPSPVDAHDKGKLNSRLNALFKGLALECRNDPEHKFFIGLAYLYGIDVETDPARGIRLIEDAADDGLVEAALKLVDIYREGVGVKRDYLKAARLQEKYIDLLSKEGDNGPDKQKLFDALFYCGELYADLCQYSAAREKLKLCQGLIPDLPEENSHALYCKVYLLLSKISGLDGDYTRFAHYGEMALASAIQNYDSHEGCSPDGLIDAYCRMGDIRFEAGNLRRAKSCFKKALALCKKMDGEGIAPMLKRALCLKSLGSVYVESNSLSLAEPLLTEAADILEKTVNETRDATLLEELLSCYYHLVTQYKNSGNVHKRDFYRGRAGMMAEAFFAMTGTFHANAVYVDNLLTQADEAAAEGRLSSAERDLNQCESFLFYLSENLKTPRLNSLLGRLYFVRGRLYRKNKDINKALDAFVKADQALSPLAAADASLKIKLLYAEALLCRGEMEKALLTREDGINTFKKSAQFLEVLSKKTDNVSVKSLLLKTYRLIAKSYLFLWDLASAAPFINSLHKLINALLGKQGSYGVALNLNESFSVMGIFYRRKKLPISAKDCFERSVNVLLPHLKNANTCEIRKMLKSSYMLLSDAMEDAGDLEGAQAAKALGEENERLAELIDKNLYNIQLMYAIAHTADVDGNTWLHEANYQEAVNMAGDLKRLGVLPSKDFLLKTAKQQKVARQALNKDIQDEKNRAAYWDLLENAISDLWRSDQSGRFSVYAQRLLELATQDLKMRGGKAEKYGLCKALNKIYTTVYVPRGRLDKALDALKKQKRLYLSIVRDDPSPKNKLELAVFYYRLANAYAEDFHNLDMAILAAHKRLRILKGLVKSTGDSAPYQGNLNSTYELLSELYLKSGNPDRASYYQNLIKED